MVVPEPVPVTERPASGSGWRFGDWADATLRALLLLVLVAGAAEVVTSLHPVWRQESDLTADLAAGRVTYVEYERGERQVRWSDGPWRWRATTLGWATSPVIEDAPDAGLLWLEQQVNASGRDVPVRALDDTRSRWWPARVVWEPLQGATMAAWVLAFLIMLARTRHRYANRWAWFWLFVVGQVGVLLYLILEPQPIWRPRSWPRTDRVPKRGGTGFVYAVLLSIAVGLLLTLTGTQFG